MGNKIHVAEVYQVKHHIFDNFNGKSDVINRMLRSEEHTSELQSPM